MHLLFQLSGKKISINNLEYDVKVPNLIKWNEQEQQLTMDECVGENLEIMLKNDSTRKRGIEILNSTMNFILKNNFLWHDFAPRNIIIDNNVISFVDFERGISLDKNIDKRYYLRENVYEEYVAFLLPNERPLSPKKIFSLTNDEKDYMLDLKNVKSNRIKLIAKKIGIEDQILYSQYLKITQMLVDAEQPYIINGNIEFPIIHLEKIMSEYGYDNYIDEIFKSKNRVLEEERDV